MVSVHRIDLLLRHFILIDRREVVRAERQALKLQVFSVFGLTVGDTEEFVFNADAVAVINVNAGFVGRHHAGRKSRAQRLIVRDGHAESIRPFMYVKAEADAVAGPVAVVDVVFPHRSPGQNIQLAAGDPFGEHGRSKADVAPEHGSVVVAFRIGERSHGHGARDVRGAFQVLSAGVHEEEAALFQHVELFGSRSIVRHRGVRSHRGDRAEGKFKGALLAAAVFQVVGSIDLA